MPKLPPNPSDPDLKAAMEKIKFVLRKYDIGAMVLLQSKTHGEWLNHITPSWSAAFIEGDKLRVRALRESFKSPEDQQETLRLTVSLDSRPMKSELEIQKAHDQLVAILLKELPMPMDEKSRLGINAAAGVLCWVLDHDHSPTFANNLAAIEQWVKDHGWVVGRQN